MGVKNHGAFWMPQAVMDYILHLQLAITPPLHRIILVSPSKSCKLDPIPTFLLQEFINALLLLLTFHCNRSIQDEVLLLS